MDTTNKNILESVGLALSWDEYYGEWHDFQIGFMEFFIYDFPMLRTTIFTEIGACFGHSVSNVNGFLFFDARGRNKGK